MLDLKVLDNEVVASVLALVIALYAATVGMKTPIPPFIVKLFKNPIFRVAFMSILLIHGFEKTPHVAFAVSLIFVLTLHYINKQEMEENYVMAEGYKAQLRK